MRLDTVDGEVIIKKSMVALDRDDKKYDGELSLSNMRIQFRGLDGEYWSYPLDDVLSVNLYENWWWPDRKGIILKFSDGRREKIFIYESKDWMLQILSTKLHYSTDQPSTKRTTHVAFSGERETLHQNLMKSFDYSELTDLCSYLGIDYEIIAGDNKEAKIRELISYCERTGRLQELFYKCQTLRPNIGWFVNM